MSNRKSIEHTGPFINISVIPLGEGSQIAMTHEGPEPDREGPCPAYIRLADLMVKFGTRPTEASIAFLREAQIKMTPEDRVALWAEIRAGLCERCGGPLPCSCRGRLIIAGQ